MSHEHLTCIDLDQPEMTGFRRFISAWLVRHGNHTLLVDPGPLSTIPRLLAELQREQVTRLDYILLTHIHIDHAGGSGALLQHYPEAKIICHPDGIRHLVAPEKLWQGSRQVLGRLAEIYGEIVPVPPSAISYEETIGSTGVRAFLTPGHAQHHLCFLLDGLLFAGEVAGTRAEVPEGVYMRPATPPRFLLPVALDSIDRMLALAPDSMVFAHYGLVDNARHYLQIARSQLLLWVRGAAVTHGLDNRDKGFVDWLLANDTIFSNGEQLPKDIKSREDYFLGNSLRGITEYVDSLPEAERRSLTEIS